MNDLNKKAVFGLVRLPLMLAAALFIPARTVRYWQAWVFLFLFSASITAISVYLMKKNPELLRRRLNAGPKAETQKSQKIIQFFVSLALVAGLVVPGRDHRFGWSSIPLYGVAAGDILVLLGMLIIFFVFRKNSFAAATVQVDEGQRVVSTGPYALVRHPMYSGVLVMMCGMPLALGSWWGLGATILMALILVWRLHEEEKFLVKNLPGYPDYRKKVKCRLVPFVW